MQRSVKPTFLCFSLARVEFPAAGLQTAPSGLGSACLCPYIAPLPLRSQHLSFLHPLLQPATVAATFLLPLFFSPFYVFPHLFDQCH